MRTDPVSVSPRTRSFFIPQKDAVIRGTGSSVCMTVGLYEHRSFHRVRNPHGWWSV